MGHHHSTPPTNLVPANGSVQWQSVSGSTFTQIAVSGQRAAAINDKGCVFYTARYNAQNTDWHKTDKVKLRWITLYDQKSCGLDTNDQVWCTDLLEEDSWHQVAGSLSTLDMSQDTVCGTNGGMQVVCAAYGSSSWQYKQGGLFNQTSIDTQYNQACAIGTDGAIYCTDDFGDSSPHWDKSNFNGQFKQVNLAGKRVCGIDSNDNIQCADFKQSNWQQITGQASFISADKMAPSGGSRNVAVLNGSSRLFSNF